MKWFYILAGLLLLMTCCGIEADKENPDTSQLSILSNIDKCITKVSPVLKDNFIDSDKIGLYVRQSVTISRPYHNLPEMENVQCIQSGGKWNMQPAVYLSPERARLFAYYPYQESLFNNSFLGVSVSDQTDYLIHDPDAVSFVNAASPVGELSFKHLQACVTILLRKDANYPDVPNLTGLTIYNIYTSHSYNIFDGSSGGSIYSPDGYSITDLNIPLPLNFPNIYDDQALNIFLIPMKLDVPLTGSLYFGDHKTDVEFPDTSELKAGMRYVYYLTKKAHELVIESVSIDNWEIEYY